MFQHGEVIYTDKGIFYTYCATGSTLIIIRSIHRDDSGRYMDYLTEEFMREFSILKRELSVAGLWMQGTPPTKGMLIKDLQGDELCTILQVYETDYKFVKSVATCGKIREFGVSSRLMKCVPYRMCTHNDIK